MARRQAENHIPSRRAFLKAMGWAPTLLLPAPLHAGLARLGSRPNLQSIALPFSDIRLTPHYPAKSPLDDVLRLVTPGSDEFITEKNASEIARALDTWGQGVKSSSPALAQLAQCIDPSIEATPLVPTHEVRLRAGGDIEVLRRQFAARTISGRDRFLEEIKNYLAGISHVETAEFLIVGLEEIPGATGRLRVDIRYDFVGTSGDMGREERVGLWRTQWLFKEGRGWQAIRWEVAEETLSRARAAI